MPQGQLGSFPLQTTSRQLFSCRWSNFYCSLSAKESLSFLPSFLFCKNSKFPLGTISCTSEPDLSGHWGIAQPQLPPLRLSVPHLPQQIQGNTENLMMVVVGTLCSPCSLVTVPTTQCSGDLRSTRRPSGSFCSPRKLSAPMVSEFPCRPSQSQRGGVRGGRTRGFSV